MIHEVASFEPIFVGGAGRSGTTLLRSMLGCHSQLAGTNEFKFIPAIMDLYGTLIRATDIRRAFRLDQEYLDDVFGLLVFSLLTPLLTESGKLRIVEKTPHNALVMDRLAMLFPRARFVHVIRDGRDVASSLLSMEWRGADGKPLPYTQDIGTAAQYWRSVIETARRQASLRHVRVRYKEVRYEDLTEDPRSVLRDLLNWLEVPWEESVLDTVQRRTHVRKEAPESSTDQVQERVYKRAVGRWRTDMRYEDRLVFERIAGSLLRDLGYATEAWWGDDCAPATAGPVTRPGDVPSVLQEPRGATVSRPAEQESTYD